MQATLKKFPQGAWFPFLVGIVMTCFMTFWRWGVTKRRTYETERRALLSTLLRLEDISEPQRNGSATGIQTSGLEQPDSIGISPVQPSALRHRQLFIRDTDTPIARLPGISIFYTSAPSSDLYAPCTFRHFLEQFPALHSTCIFLFVRTASQSYVPDSDKLVLEPW